MDLFTVNITLKGGELFKIGFESIWQLVHDQGLAAMFNEPDLVVGVKVTSRHGQHIAKPPILTWERLLSDVVDNAATIWREGLS